MSTVRIALANLRYPSNPSDSVKLVEEAIAEAASQRATIICFPECYVPGYRLLAKNVPPPDADFLERAWTRVAAAAARASVATRVHARSRKSASGGGFPGASVDA